MSGVFFFFQAEDGIRDVAVTGVQTCALPIFHLGAAHLAELLRRFGRADAAIAAYNAGPIPVRRWLDREGANDPDRFIELIPYPETRGYVRSVLRNRELYRALYGPPRAP